MKDTSTPDERETVIILNDLGDLTLTAIQGSDRAQRLAARLGPPTWTSRGTCCWEIPAGEDLYDPIPRKRLRPLTPSAKLQRERAKYHEKPTSPQPQTS